MKVDRLIGTQLGGYQIRALLGSGGLDSVYKGYDAALDREVAIKVISTAGQPDDFVARFQREARLAASLRHANMVQIYHFEEQSMAAMNSYIALRCSTLRSSVIQRRDVQLNALR